MLSIDNFSPLFVLTCQHFHKLFLWAFSQDIFFCNDNNSHLSFSFFTYWKESFFNAFAYHVWYIAISYKLGAKSSQISIVCLFHAVSWRVFPPYLFWLFNISTRCFLMISIHTVSFFTDNSGQKLVKSLEIIYFILSFDDFIHLLILTCQHFPTYHFCLLIKKNHLSMPSPSPVV